MYRREQLLCCKEESRNNCTALMLILCSDRYSWLRVDGLEGQRCGCGRVKEGEVERETERSKV